VRERDTDNPPDLRSSYLLDDSVEFEFYSCLNGVCVCVCVCVGGVYTYIGVHLLLPDGLQHNRPASCYHPAAFIRHLLFIAVRDNSVGIATHYGLYSPEIET